MARYRLEGLAGLARPVRRDAGLRRTRTEMVALIEGMALRKPRPSIAGIHRRIAVVAEEMGRPRPSIGTVPAIAGSLDPLMMTLA